MISLSMILSIILAAIVLFLLWQIVTKLAAKFGVDPFWLNIIYLVILIFVIIWAFGLFGISQPIVR